MPATDYVSAINVHIFRSVVPGHAGGHVPGRSAAYENQALQAQRRFFLQVAQQIDEAAVAR